MGVTGVPWWVWEVYPGGYGRYTLVGIELGIELGINLTKNPLKPLLRAIP